MLWCVCCEKGPVLTDSYPGDKVWLHLAPCLQLLRDLLGLPLALTCLCAPGRRGGRARRSTQLAAWVLSCKLALRPCASGHHPPKCGT